MYLVRLANVLGHDRKIGGAEKERLPQADLGFYRSEYERLQGELQNAAQTSTLPEAPRGGATLHDLLVRLRLSQGER
jgi:uncharacterized protein